MSWQGQMSTIVRHLISDVDSSAYTFSAQRIATLTLLLRLINKSNHKSKQNMLSTKFQHG